MDDPAPVERLNRLRDLFERASNLSEGDRSRFLENSCSADDDLRREVAALLDEAESRDSPFDALVNEMVWPALDALRRDPSKLGGWLDDVFQADGGDGDPLVGKSVSRFEVRETVGRGGMGVVYRARDRLLDRTVALKFLPPALGSDQAAKERFIHEAKAASGLDHPNIATVYEVGETEDHELFIAMAFYPGETLKERIARGPVPPETAVDLAIQLAGALSAAHAHGVVHRDIKPGNVMVTAEGSVKLLDFGLAKLSHESGYTRTGPMIGTIAYMAPEQARGGAIDERTDLWAFGVVLYEMLTGRPPFHGENVQVVIRSILEEKPDPPATPDGAVPRPVEAILGLCLAKDPGRRYQRAADLLEDLERAREGLSPRRSGGRATWKRRPRRRWLSVAGLAAAAVVVATILLQKPAPSDESVFTRMMERAETAGVAPPVRAPPAYTFTRVTEGPIVEATGSFLICAWGDVDGDGYLDVVITESGDEKGSINLYRNNRDATFSPVSGIEGFTGVDRPWGPIWADQDNDGDLDLFVTTGTGHPNLFFRGDGRGGFARVTDGEWVSTPRRSEGAAWGDYDNDGWVDLFVVDVDTKNPVPNRLYRNRGDGTMEPVEASFTRIPSVSHGGIWTDRDNDGDLDLFIAGQDPVHFRNDGTGILTPVPARPYGIPEYTRDVDIGFSSADYDNDGIVDIAYIVWGVGSGTLLYRNEGGRSLTDVTYLLPPVEGVRGVGAMWGDYDNDGFVDLLVSNNLGKNLLYHNEGGDAFSLVTEGPIVEEGMRTLGAGWADYDNDGDLDLLVLNGAGGKFGQACELFRNDGGTNHWISVALVGTVSNRSGIGAKVWVKAGIGNNDITQLREITSDGFNMSGLRAHFGLGDAAVVDTLRVEWPSGIVQELHAVAADQFLTITEEPAGSNPSE